MKVWSLGDAVVDLIPLHSMQYEACAGGAPVNVAAGVAKLGIPSGFIGRVGEDAFGHFMQKTLFDIGVDTSAMEFDERYRTSTVLVSLHENGEREFSFLVSPSADQFLSNKNLPRFEKDILHFCSLALVHPVCRASLNEAIDKIQQAGGLLSFDINIRPQMWSDPIEMHTKVDEFAYQADILKLSEDELLWLVEEVTLDRAIEKLKNYPARLKVVTQGAKGCLVLTPTHQIGISAYRVESVDTTGAGDAFMAGLLAAIAQFGVSDNDDDLMKVITQATACGALATTRKGAISAAPSQQELTAFIHQQPPLHIRER
ncbi:TPA: aminoimidazole riboside kinase [Providencia stuartii]|uniref:Kinase, PfkB family n=1 Tax=Providencia stuartii ATCC 25827 TaxID=471874 RepID=A0AA86YP55_PROST|nr:MULTISPECIES: aminoimidazole riboside kinase [Providencia]EDU60455.1 kinase, PfkB family [Providencia stuartii ATCC 25827]MBN5559605.1 aminoimidazole riboside kinase [Providencia stuartii]MBN5599581.1 aminoimidazole riboside kinase [Providencia stuartii]MBN5603099.1 aminoimidazole riboside kinase [Providencia stuartii]MBS7784743.1 aminoimidazole riboside kinase [Providencia thailandensis]